jgi:plastocyanin
MHFRGFSLHWLTAPALGFGLALAVLAAHPLLTGADGGSVSIANFVFAPASVSITAGDTVIWTNNDEAVHDVTDRGGSWGSDIMNTGDTFSYTFMDPGTYAYICKLHPWMSGSVIVTAP